MVGRIGRDYFLLDFQEVLALQAEREMVWIISAKRRFLASQTLQSIETNLPVPRFQRIHRNAIVNTDHVRRLTAITSHRWILTLSNEQEFVVSKRKAHYIRRLLQRLAQNSLQPSRFQFAAAPSAAVLPNRHT